MVDQSPAAPAVRAPEAVPPARGMRARLARMGSRSQTGNPVLEPLLRIVRSNDPKIETSTLRQIERAYQVAERWHRGQKRKSGEPYISHPVAVADLLADLHMDAQTIVAAILHDVLEDTPTTAAEVSERFGPRVCQLVQALSDDKSLPRKRRRQIVLQELPEMDALVKVIKLADLTSNIKLLPQSWSLEHQLEYLEWSESAASICEGECPALAELYWQRAQASRASLERSRAS